MLLKYLVNQSTPETYRKSIKKMEIAGAVLIVIGVITLLFCNVSFIDKIPDFILGFYEGTGIGLILFGAILAIRNYRLLKNEEKLRKTRIESADERNQTIFRSAMSVTVCITLFALYLGLLVSPLVDMTAFYTMLTVAAFYVVIMFGSVLICRLRA